MSFDLLFRGWNPHSKSFIYNKEDIYVIFKGRFYENHFGDLLRLPFIETPDQHIGFMDKNKNKIFINDIIKFKGFKLIIKWDKNLLRVVFKELNGKNNLITIDTPIIWDKDVEIIGHIYL